MRKALIITNYTDETDAILDIKASSVHFGCTDNDNFDFTKDELNNLKARLLNYRDKLSRVPTGNKADITLKKQTKKLLAALMSGN